MEARTLRTPSFRVDDRVALVTGAGRGIGMACALALADAGADLVLLSRTSEELDRVAAEVRRRGRLATPIACDVSDVDQLVSALDLLERIDILVISAGINIPQAFVDVSEQTFDRMIAVNIKGAFFTSQIVTRKMIKHGQGGVVIHISSDFGHVGSHLDRTVYCSTKHAVEGLTRAMALELAPHGIRVNSVAPTFIETPLTRPFLSDPSFAVAVLGRIPLGRLGRAEDVMGAVVFLASPAASLITGASVLVDGGWTAQ